VHLPITRSEFLRLLVASPAALAGAARAAQVSATVPRCEQFADRILQDTAAAMLSFGVYMGDRLGIYASMKGAGPATLQELARKTGLNQRYLKEWLGLMVTARYLDYEPTRGNYSLPPEHATVLCDEKSPLFMAGYVESLASVFVTPKVMQGFRGGKGPASADFLPEYWEGIERSTAPDYRNFLTQVFLPAVPEVNERLKNGGTALDLGCGGGVASIAIAKAYPKAQVFGFDVFPPAIEKARENAAKEAVSSHARFEVYDGVSLPSSRFDLITLFWTLHHVVDPVKLLTSVRGALTRGGTLLVLEANVAEKLEDNINTWANWLYGASMFDCAVTSATEGGPAYGALMKESEVRELAHKAGFTHFRRLSVESRWDALYEIKA
jgi:2-polyprenyl-3-methyl-5-hydroxy-6-metoxy-1,4-benzoquinol methylase